MKNRNFYRDRKGGAVFEYDDQQVDDGLVREGLVAMRDHEVSAHLAPQPVTKEQVERMRLIAYADPVTGSDRFKAEADAERLAGNEEAALEAERNLLARREQIKAENPWPVEVDE